MLREEPDSITISYREWERLHDRPGDLVEEFEEIFEKETPLATALKILGIITFLFILIALSINIACLSVKGALWAVRSLRDTTIKTKRLKAGNAQQKETVTTEPKEPPAYGPFEGPFNWYDRCIADNKGNVMIFFGENGGSLGPRLRQRIAGLLNKTGRFAKFPAGTFKQSPGNADTFISEQGIRFYIYGLIQEDLSPDLEMVQDLLDALQEKSYPYIEETVDITEIPDPEEGPDFIPDPYIEPNDKNH